MRYESSFGKFWTVQNTFPATGWYAQMKVRGGEEPERMPLVCWAVVERPRQGTKVMGMVATENGVRPVEGQPGVFEDFDRYVHRSDIPETPTATAVPA